MTDSSEAQQAPCSNRLDGFTTQSSGHLFIKLYNHCIEKGLSQKTPKNLDLLYRLPLQLIQEGQLSVTGESMCT